MVQRFTPAPGTGEAPNASPTSDPAVMRTLICGGVSGIIRARPDLLGDEIRSAAP